MGRAGRSGPLDDITQKSGRWPTRPGEIDDNDLSGTRGSVGQLTTITVTSLPGKPKLAIVGWGSLPAQDDTQNAWTVPGEITALEQAGAPRQEQMLYTFSHAAGQTLVLVTHSPGLAARYAKRTVQLLDGQPLATWRQRSARSRTNQGRTSWSTVAPPSPRPSPRNG